MRFSTLFLAFILVITAAILLYFGLAALSPIPEEERPVTIDDLYAQPLEQPEIVFGNPTRGPKSAVVTIVEFGDFLCSACGSLEETLLTVLPRFADDVRLVWKDFPNTQHDPEALPAAIAARCAGRQGAFWDYHDMLYANQASIDSNAYAIFADALDLDVDQFTTCIDTEATRPVVQKDFVEGQRLQIDATPYLFIGENRISGALTETQLDTFIRLELTKAEQSGSDVVADPAQE